MLLTFAVKQLSVTTAYAVRTGLGAVGISPIRILMLAKARIRCGSRVAAIFAGVIGTHLLDGEG